MRYGNIKLCFSLLYVLADIKSSQTFSMYVWQAEFTISKTKGNNIRRPSLIAVSRLRSTCTACGWDLYKQRWLSSSSGMRSASPVWQGWQRLHSWCPYKPGLENSLVSSGKKQDNWKCKWSFPIPFVFSLFWNTSAAFLWTLGITNRNLHVFIVVRSKTAVVTDERIRLMNEVVSGIRIIKMYAWEKPFSALVTEVRR